MFNFLRKKRQLPLSVFLSASKEIDAYKLFLKENKIIPEKVHTIKDFTSTVPLMEKDNYLYRYPFVSLVRNGRIPPMISASSGSSGKPFYWPRGDDQEQAGGILHKRIFKDIFKIEGKRTLVIVCFSMGNWIAGTFTAASCRYVAREKNMQISVITPGIEKEDIITVIRDLAPQFETVILAGYPPFLMDIINETKRRSIPLNIFSLKFLFAGEGFSEYWRDLICSSAGVADSISDTVSVYGTADAGALGHETPLSIMIRKTAGANEKFREILFGNEGFVPSLVHFDPNVIYFESVNGHLAFTADTGIPLIRYNIKDKGVVLKKTEIIEAAKSAGVYDVLAPYLKKWSLPLVGLFGRSDVAVTFYALNIYPENIKAAVERGDFSRKLTGKFIARVDSDISQTEQTLVVMFELEESIETNDQLKEEVRTALFESLIKLNTEYRKLYNSIREKAYPSVELVPYGNEVFKIKKNKQSWIKKS